MPATIAERVIAVVAKFQKVSAEQILVETTFEQLGMDSLDGVELLFALENEFDTTIPDEEARRIHDVRQAVESLQKLMPGSNSDARPTAMS